MPKKSLKEQLEDAHAEIKVFIDKAIKKQAECDKLMLKLLSQKEGFDREKSDLQSKMINLKDSLRESEGRVTLLLDIIKNLSLHLASSK